MRQNARKVMSVRVSTMPGITCTFCADEMADVDVALDVEFGENVEIAGDRIDLRGDLGLGQRAGDLVGAPERAFDLDEKRLHRAHLPLIRRALVR